MAGADQLIARTAAAFRDDFAVDVRLRHRVEEIDVGRGAVRVHDLSTGARAWEGYDESVVATAAVPVRPPNGTSPRRQASRWAEVVPSPWTSG